MPHPYLNDVVALDTDSPLTYLGRLIAADDAHYTLRDAVLYDTRVGRVTAEHFLAESAAEPPSATRREVLVARARVLSVSKLSDIVVPGKR